MRSALHKKFLPPFKGGSLDPLMIGLESYWALDELSGTRYDSIGSNDLTDNNTVNYVNDGPRGVNASIVGNNTEYLSKATTGLRQAGDFTISGWFKFTAVPGGDAKCISYIDGGGTDDFSLYQGAFTYNIYAQVRDSVAGVVTVFETVLANEWHFFTMRYNSVDKKVYLSVDGKGESASAALANGLLQAGTEFRVGLPGGAQEFKVGRVGFWSEGISAPERLELYNSGRGKSYSDLSAGIKTNLVSYWNLDEVSGNRADSYGANTLTDNSTVMSINDGPEQVVADFVAANVETLSSASADFDFSGNVPFTIVGWVKTSGSQNGIFGKWTGGDWGYAVLTDGTNARPIFRVEFSIGGSYTEVRAPVGCDINDGNWHLIECWHDPVADVIGIAVDNRSNTAAHNQGVGTSTNPFELGGNLGAGVLLTGKMGRVGIWGKVLSGAERLELFNSGVGKKYSELSAGIKTNLVSYWNLTELSGNRADSHGANTLTDNNTVMSVINMPDVADKVCAKFIHTNTESLSVASGVFNANADYTVSFWLNISGGNTWAFPFVAYTADYSDAPLLVQWHNINGLYALGHIPGADPLIQDADYPINVWTHVLITWDFATRTMELFVNGASQGSDAAAGPQSSPVPTNLRLAGGNFGGTDYFISGQMDEVAVWQRKLTGIEITRLFNLGKGVFYPTFT